MDCNNIIKEVQKNKILIFLGWFFLFFGIISFFATIIFFVNKSARDKDYNMEYVYNDNGVYYYLNDGSNVYVNKIISNDKKIISPSIPNKKTVKMYCNKNNINECIYYDINHESEENPIILVIVTLVLLSMSSFVLIGYRRNISDKQQNRKKISFNNVFLFAVLLFSIACYILIVQISNVISYIKLKNDNNITYATVYSEIYTNNSNNYKAVSYYHVNNKKYIYVDDHFEKGSLNIGKKIELYYDMDNPTNAVKKGSPVNIKFTLICLLFLIFSVPILLFKKKAEDKYYKGGFYGIFRNNEYDE